MAISLRALRLAARLLLAPTALCGVALAAPACGPGTGPGARGANRALPPYGGHAAELFDDAIEPRALGLELDQTQVSKGDPILRERTQVADAIVVVQVTTITSKHEDSGETFSLGLRVLQRLFGQYPPPDELTVRVGKTSPSVGLIRSLESRIVGKRLVFFVRDFSSGDEAETHFHAVAESKEQLAAIRDAAALAEMK
jgi:hypothetical protein